MPDIHNKAVRSKNMRAIKSSGNRSTEKRLIVLLKKSGLKGWRRHPNLNGKPDFVFPKQRIAVFVDGCFWHGCKKHFTIPTTNRKFWLKKIQNNMKRDKTVSSELRKSGWKVVRVWEHEVKKRIPKSIICSFSK